MPPRPSSTLQINGRKRHILTDTAGHLIALVVHAASVQDRDGAIAVLASTEFRVRWGDWGLSRVSG